MNRRSFIGSALSAFAGVVAAIYVPSMPLVSEDAIPGAPLRGGVRSRHEAYNVGSQGGWLSANDIRRWEDMNPRKLVDLGPVTFGNMT